MRRTVGEGERAVDWVGLVLGAWERSSLVGDKAISTGTNRHGESRPYQLHVLANIFININIYRCVYVCVYVQCIPSLRSIPSYSHPPSGPLAPLCWLLLPTNLVCLDPIGFWTQH